MKMVSLEQFMESIADKFASIEETLRLLTISALDREFSSYLQGDLLTQAKNLLTDIALEVGETRTEDLRKLFGEKLSGKLPDLQKALIAEFLKHL